MSVYEDYIRERIEQLRLEKKISERKMSLDLGHSTSYVHAISTGRALPSLGEFLYICEYFKITPKNFFDDEKDFSAVKQEIISRLSDLDEDEARAVLEIIKHIMK